MPEKDAAISESRHELALNSESEWLKEVALVVLHGQESLATTANQRKGNTSFKRRVEQFETGLIRALAKTKGNQARAALALGIKPTTLNNKMTRYGIGSKSPERSKQIDPGEFTPK